MKSLLRRVLPYLEGMDDPSYGHFLGGNPNNFTPDPECSTEEERAAHKAACERYAAMGAADPDVSFGLGTNVNVDPELTKLIAEIRQELGDK